MKSLNLSEQQKGESIECNDAVLALILFVLTEIVIWVLR